MPKKILVVDDDEEIVSLTKQILEREGYLVLTAYDGDEGYRQTLLNKPNLVLLDIVMPKKDGFTVLKEIKNNNDIRTVPVVMLSAKGESESLFKGMTEGAVDYFIKPYDARELISFIRKYVD